MTPLLDIHKTMLMGEAYGLTDKQVIPIIGISIQHYKYHWNDLKTILGVKSRTAAVVKALQEGIIDIKDIHVRRCSRNPRPSEPVLV